MTTITKNIHLNSSWKLLSGFRLWHILCRWYDCAPMCCERALKQWWERENYEKTERISHAHNAKPEQKPYTNTDCARDNPYADCWFVNNLAASSHTSVCVNHTFFILLSPLCVSLLCGGPTSSTFSLTHRYWIPPWE